MSKNFIEGLYDAAKVDPSQEMSSSEKRKFSKMLDSNKTLFKQNKDIFAETEPKFLTCKRYIPCPVCHKCKAKASHLYVSCQTCTIPICRHTYNDAKLLIKRESFQVRATSDLAKVILQLEKDMEGRNSNV